MFDEVQRRKVQVCQIGITPLLHLGDMHCISRLAYIITTLTAPSLDRCRCSLCPSRTLPTMPRNVRESINTSRPIDFGSQQRVCFEPEILHSRSFLSFGLVRQTSPEDEHHRPDHTIPQVNDFIHYPADISGRWCNFHCSFGPESTALIGAIAISLRSPASPLSVLQIQVPARLSSRKRQFVHISLYQKSPKGADSAHRLCDISRCSLSAIYTAPASESIDLFSHT